MLKEQDDQKSIANPAGVRLLASQFCTDNVPPHDVVLPPDYLIWTRGLYAITQDPENIQEFAVVRLSKVPFFIAGKEETGKALLIRFLNGQWLSDWVLVKNLGSKNLYLNFLIMPSPGVKFKELINYAFNGVIEAPFVTISDPALQAVLQELLETQYLYPDNKYPILVNVSKVKEMCQKYEVDYNFLRQWLFRRCVIRHASQIQRDGSENKPARFLVFERSIEDLLKDFN